MAAIYSSFLQPYGFLIHQANIEVESLTSVSRISYIVKYNSKSCKGELPSENILISWIERHITILCSNYIPNSTKPVIRSTVGGEIHLEFFSLLTSLSKIDVFALCFTFFFFSRIPL